MEWPMGFAGGLAFGAVGRGGNVYYGDWWM